MVIIYTSPGCSSCRKAIKWMQSNDIHYVEKNVFSNTLREDEIKYLLSRCDNGTEDIISIRSKAFQSLKKGIDDLSINELVKTIQREPSILKRPILLSEKSMTVGFDTEEITAVARI